MLNFLGLQFTYSHCHFTGGTAQIPLFTMQESDHKKAQKNLTSFNHIYKHNFYFYFILFLTHINNCKTEISIINKTLPFTF
jgi:hypothetical protein